MCQNLVEKTTIASWPAFLIYKCNKDVKQYILTQFFSPGSWIDGHPFNTLNLYIVVLNHQEKLRVQLEALIHFLLEKNPLGQKTASRVAYITKL